MTDITLSQDHFEHYQATVRAMVTLVTRETEYRAEIDALRAEVGRLEQVVEDEMRFQLADLGADPKTVRVVDERDVDRTFEGLSEHGVRQPRVIQFGERIPADVLIVRPDNATDFDRFAVRVAGGGWNYTESIAKAHEVAASPAAIGFPAFDQDEYPLTEVLPATIAKAS